MAARKVMLEEHEIAVLEPLVLSKEAPDPGKRPDILVPHDERRTAERQLVLADVGAADTRNFDLHQRRVGRDVRKVEFPQLRGRWSDFQCGNQFFCHSQILAATSRG